MQLRRRSLLGALVVVAINAGPARSPFTRDLPHYISVGLLG